MARRIVEAQAAGDASPAPGTPPETGLAVEAGGGPTEDVESTATEPAITGASPALPAPAAGGEEVAAEDGDDESVPGPDAITDEDAADEDGDDARAPAENGANAIGATTSAAPTRRRSPSRFRGMTIDDIRRLYVETLGRSTDSEDAAYLIWRIKSAERGKIPIGPTRGGLRGRFAEMSVEELQRAYGVAVGRPTTSTDRDYLKRTIRNAELGRVRTGPRTAAHYAAADLGEPQVLSLRMPEAVVTQLDEAWRRLGFANRMALFRAALREFLASAGEAGVAACFLAPAPARNDASIDGDAADALPSAAAPA